MLIRVRARRVTPGGQTMCVEMVSLGKAGRSTSSTRYSLRGSSMVVREPADRAPTMIASYGITVMQRPILEA